MSWVDVEFLSVVRNYLFLLFNVLQEIQVRDSAVPRDREELQMCWIVTRNIVRSVTIHVQTVASSKYTADTES